MKSCNCVVHIKTWHSFTPLSIINLELAILVLFLRSFCSDHFVLLLQNLKFKFYFSKMNQFLIISLAFVCVFNGIVAFLLENAEKSNENNFIRWNVEPFVENLGFLLNYHEKSWAKIINVYIVQDSTATIGTWPCSACSGCNWK